MITGIALSDREIARLLGGQRVRPGQVLAPGPNHSPRDRSLAVFADGSTIRVTSHAGDSWQECEAHVRQRLGLPLFDSPPADYRPRPTQPQADDTDQRERQARALQIWDEAKHPKGSPITAYMERRGIRLPAEAAGDAIRWHPAAPFAGERIGVMVALCRDVRTGEPRAVHRTAIDGAGNKAAVKGQSRLSLGPIAGTAVMLTPSEDVTLSLGVAEGIESTISMRAIPEFGPSPIWAVLSAGGMSSFPLLSGIETLWIGVDRDDAGERAAGTLADRWREAGREVIKIRPRVVKTDLNDLSRGSAE